MPLDLESRDTMAKFRESFNSREVSDNKGGRTITYRALITGASDADAAEDLALSEMPNVISSGGATLLRQSYEITHEGAGVYRVEAEYGEDDQHQPEQGGEQQGDEGGQSEPPSGQGDDDPLGPEWNFVIAESTVHITQSLATLHSYARVGLPAVPDYKKAIGVTKERIEGCDIIAPKETRSVTVRVAGMSNAYLKKVRKLFGHTNSQKMMGCEIGEVLYTGFNANYRAKELWSLTHNFAIAENLEWDANDAEMVKRLTVGTIQLLNGKRAWSHLWIAYEESPDVITKSLVEIPRYAFEEQVYPAGNLKILGV